MATVNKKSGRPSVRTVVFRGFCCCTAGGSGAEEVQTSTLSSIDTSGGDKGASFPMIITDTRSQKYADFVGGSDCEICWWLDESGVQFRISGRVVLATAKTAHPALLAACQDVWERLSDGTKRTFFWAEPGKPRTAVDAAAGGVHDEDGGISPHFALCIIVPDRVDELHLGGNQKRLIYLLPTQDAASAAHASATEAAIELLLSGTKHGWSVQDVNP